MSNLPPPTEVVPTDGGGVFCRNCGHEMDPALTVCPNCQTPRAGVAEPSVTQAAPVAAATSSRRTVVDEGYAGDTVVADPFWSPQMMGLAALVLVILVVVLFVALGRNGDTTTTTTTTATTATTVTQTSIVVVPGAPAPQAPIIIQQPPAQTAPPQTSPPQTSPPQTSPPTTQATTSSSGP
jgi:hypothetical protein